MTPIPSHRHGSLLWKPEPMILSDKQPQLQGANLDSYKAPRTHLLAALRVDGSSRGLVKVTGVSPTHVRLTMGSFPAQVGLLVELELFDSTLRLYEQARVTSRDAIGFQCELITPSEMYLHWVVKDSNRKV